ncbi:hypothetical protein [Propioniciclava sp.]|uniref:hypothetical protein n=1 Tax=Propioniciclava sp. TaxID=2038686 RepID=UPI002628C0BF|nr:hypothetical protein [Propioniciclava sp.]
MVPPWWGIGVILVVGTALVWFGWWSDRRRNQRAAAALREPPVRPIPGLVATDAPAYVTEDDLQLAPAASPSSLPSPVPHPPDDAPSLPGGVPDAAFLTGGRAAADHPLVLVTDTALTTDRRLLPALVHARRDQRPLVLVAPAFSDAALGTLRANHATGRVQTIPVILAERTTLRRAVALTGGRLVPGEDLDSGWLPAECWGTCATWLADDETSWVVLEG